MFPSSQPNKVSEESKTVSLVSVLAVSVAESSAVFCVLPFCSRLFSPSQRKVEEAESSTPPEKWEKSSKTVLSVSVLAFSVAASSAFSCVSCVNHCVSDSHESPTKSSNSEVSFSSEPSAQSDKSSLSPKLLREFPPPYDIVGTTYTFRSRFWLKVFSYVF